MKKMFLTAALFMAVCQFGYAQNTVDSTKVKPIVTEISKISKETKPGTVYGVTHKDKNKYTVSTPFGDMHFTTNNRGYYNLFGIEAQVTLVAPNVYHIASNIGDWELNVRRLTLTKKK